MARRTRYDPLRRNHVFRIAAPLPILGRIAETLFLRRYMIALNRERNRVIKLLDAGFTFTYPEWPAAARELVSRHR